jgi:hypothetical protein
MAGAKGRRWTCRSRPGSMCRKWFVPDPRTRKTQRTCSEACSRERHRRRSAEWRRRNADEEKEDRLRRSLVALEQPGDGEPAAPTAQIRWDRAQAAIGMKSSVVIEESSQVLERWVRALMRPKEREIHGESSQVPGRRSRAAMEGPARPP